MILSGISGIAFSTYRITAKYAGCVQDIRSGHVTYHADIQFDNGGTIEYTSMSGHEEWSFIYRHGLYTFSFGG